MVKSQSQADRLAQAYFNRIIGACGCFRNAIENDHCWRYETFAGMGGFPVGFIRVMKQSGEVSLPGQPLLTMEELGVRPAAAKEDTPTR